MAEAQDKQIEPTRWAILIGVQGYEHVQPLKYCAKDIHDLEAAMHEVLEIPKSRIFTLSDRTKSKPDFANIFHFLGEIKEKQDIAPEDIVYFFFSGHGMADGKGKNDFLLPIGATFHALQDTGIRLSKIVDLLEDTKCNNIVMFLDACRTPVEGGKAPVGLGQGIKGELERRGIVTFFSCDPLEQSYEIKELENGAFTYCILQALQEPAIKTVEDLNDYLKVQVPAVNVQYKVPRQLPYLVAKPQEKALLEIFASEAAEAATIEDLETLAQQWAEAWGKGEIDDKVYYAGLEIVARDRRSPREESQLRLIRLYCTGQSTAQSFLFSWRGVSKAKLGKLDIRGPKRFQ